MDERDQQMTKIPNLNKIYIYVNDKRVSVSAFLLMDKAEIRTVYASGCTALASPFYAGDDSRGYSFLHMGKGVRAGCRNFTFAQARKHWGSGGESDRPDCLALVEKIIAHAAKIL